MSETTLIRRRRSRSRTNNPSNVHHKSRVSSSRNLSPSPRFRTPAPNNRSKPPRPTKLLLQRWKSEPILSTSDHGDNQNPEEPCTVLYRPQTCTDIFVSPSASESCQSPSNHERFDKDAKVVVSVTVEGSPGPVRTLVRLGASVEETIENVVNRYSKEGRRPHLIGQDKLSAFDLHHSHFSLESISKNAKIGEVGSRSFYLRRNNSSRSSNSSKEDGKPSREGTLIVAGEENSVLLSPFVLISAFLARKLSKIGRRTRKLWKVMGCLTCG